MLWTRPSGSTIELEDTKNLTEFALSQGWIKEVKAEVKPKRKRRTKEEMKHGNSGSSNKGNTARDTS